MSVHVRTAALAVVVGVIGCSGGSSRSTVAVAPGVAPASSTAAPVGSAAASPSAVDFAALVQGVEARGAAFLQFAAQGTNHYAAMARLETGGPFLRQPIDEVCDHMDARKDTADFKLTALLRLVHLYGGDPAIPADLSARIEQTLLNFRYWIDEPGNDPMVFWSENHQIMFAAGELLVGQLYPQTVFPNSGLTGDQHRAKARPRVLAWLDARLRYGFSEWYSPVYYPHDVSPLLNLVDFAHDPVIATRAAMVLDLLIYDLARLTVHGSFGTTAGRIYVEHKLDGHYQSIGDLIEILFGTRGEFRARGTTAASAFVSSTRYRVPHVLLGIGVDRERARYVGRARVGLTFAEAAREGRGFSTFEDGMFWWGQGGYLAPETIALSRRMIEAWDLWDKPDFQPFQLLRNVPEVLLPGLSQTLSPVSRGTVLAGADTYCFRNPHAQLSSVIDYGRGQVAFQQHAWQATLDMDAFVFTTAPGNLGRSPGPGRWTGSASLPQVVQSEDVALVLYNPARIQRLLFPRETHAYFPLAGFDEALKRGAWIYGRKGEGYLALYSAQPTQWAAAGPQASTELVAPGMRNVWVCQVGCQAEDGSFLDFVDAVSNAPITVVGAGDGALSDPLHVRYEAPGLGTLELEWGQTATLDGAPLHVAPFPRFDDPYAQQAWGDPQLEVRHAGASLRHDRLAGTRAGEGL